MLPSEIISPELSRHLCSISHQIGRQVGVLISREGVIRKVIVGTAQSLTVPEIGRLRGGPGRFRGLRLVHTHLSGEPLSEDDLNDLALLRLDLVAMVEVLGDGLPGRAEWSYLIANSESEASVDPFIRMTAPTVHEVDFDVQATVQALEAELARVRRPARGSASAERALVVGVTPDDRRFAEMVQLVESAGVVVGGELRQKRHQVNPRTVLGKGKLTEVVLKSMQLQVEVAIFDIDLKPAQARAFEDATGLKAIDRTQLILDIFAQRARSRDGKLQVELAQLKYSLPRLTQQDAGLSRLTGGIGGRGPGETVLEVGRRRARDRIRSLEKQIERLSRQRDVRRSRRRKEGIPVLSIIGYTNAGKSSLLNALTNSRVAAEARLFMTLDPTSRRLRFPREGEVIITDTVGFISDLPPDLATAFRATLEELADADLLLHVIDAADPDLSARMAAVEEILEQLDLLEIPRMRVLNKIDLLEPHQIDPLIHTLDAVAVSATRRRGLRRLLEAAESRLGPGKLGNSPQSLRASRAEA